jgi:signal transduction histidine kinase
VADGEDAALSPGRFLRVTVADTGSGMPPEVLARVGEPFFTTKPAGRGTGLGLSLARRFAERAGGALRLASRTDQGTTVTLWLREAVPPPP